MFEVYRDMLSICSRLYQKEYVAATDGNVSARLGKNRILCTPTGMNKGDIRQGDLVTVNEHGAKLEGQRNPSTEMPMHLAIYGDRPEINAVVHAHPPYATGFASAGEGLTGCVLPELVVSLGAVPLAPYATPSTHEVPDNIREFIRTHDVVLLENHGVVAAGKDLWQAYYNLEKVEHAARIIFISRLLGGERRLDSQQVSRLRGIAEQSYGIDAGKKPSCEPANLRSFNASPPSSHDEVQLRDAISQAIKELGF
ncbi:MAG: aldolase [Ectothiorhodospiraceae bacterium]|nr:aldolase [Ectothiorhodospiraceae bacterium]